MTTQKAFSCYASLTTEEVNTLKNNKRITCDNIILKGYNHDLPFSNDIVLDKDNKPRLEFVHNRHFNKVSIVDDNTLILNRLQARKVLQEIKAQGYSILYDKFKQFTETQKKDPIIKEWLHRFDELKKGNSEVTTQQLTKAFNEWRASNGYCRATKLILDSENNICEAVEVTNSNYIVDIYQIVEMPKVEF